MKAYNGFPPDQRTRALHWLKRQYASGHREPPHICDACGQTEGIIEAHSEDYSAPFAGNIGQYGFCYTCHMMLHCRFRAPAAWDRYREAIRRGATFRPYFTRNFPSFSTTFLQGELPKPRNMRMPPERFVLDEIHDAQRPQS